MTEEHWLTVDEAAKRLKVHPESIRRWLREGKMRGHLISRRGGYRIRPAELETFLEQRTQEGATAGKPAA